MGKTVYLISISLITRIEILYMNVHKYPQSTDKDQHIHHSYHSAPSSLSLGLLRILHMRCSDQSRIKCLKFINVIHKYNKEILLMYNT